MCLGLFFYSLQGCTPGSEVGRYQIIQGHSDEYNIVFKINSVTGRTWVFNNKLANWTEISDPAGLPNSQP